MEIFHSFSPSLRSYNQTDSSICLVHVLSVVQRLNGIVSEPPILL